METRESLHDCMKQLFNNDDQLAAVRRQECLATEMYFRLTGGFQSVLNGCYNFVFRGCSSAG
jgi:hypothetical protein